MQGLVALFNPESEMLSTFAIMGLKSSVCTFIESSKVGSLYIHTSTCFFNIFMVMYDVYGKEVVTLDV